VRPPVVLDLVVRPTREASCNCRPPEEGTCHVLNFYTEVYTFSCVYLMHTEHIGIDSVICISVVMSTCFPTRRGAGLWCSPLGV
jgi:hypothetical protein